MCPFTYKVIFAVVIRVFLQFESCIPFFQAAKVFKTMASNGKPCLAIPYDIPVIFLKQPIEAQSLLSQLKICQIPTNQG